MGQACCNKYNSMIVKKQRIYKQTVQNRSNNKKRRKVLEKHRLGRKRPVGGGKNDTPLEGRCYARKKWSKNGKLKIRNDFYKNKSGYTLSAELGKYHRFG